MEGFDKLCDWLGITPQQRRILEAILALTKESSAASPEEIMKAEAKASRSPRIQRSNFFRQLKKLQELGYVRRASEASYEVDFARMRESLAHMQEKRAYEMNELQRALKSASDYLEAELAGIKGLEVTFMPGELWQGRFASMVPRSRSCYLTGIFPKMVYGHSPLFMESDIGRIYALRLWKRCVQDRELAITYLTRLDTDYLFRRLRGAGVEPRMACSEICKLLDSIEALMKRNPHLSFYYTPSPYGIDIGIPDTEKLRDFFLFFRNKDKGEVGAVYINSPPLAMQFRELFLSECETSVDLRSAEGLEVMERKRSQLESIRKRHGKT